MYKQTILWIVLLTCQIFLVISVKALNKKKVVEETSDMIKLEITFTNELFSPEFTKTTFFW